MSESHFAPGLVLPPHFELIESIGAGYYGEVFRARDTMLGRLVAIKVLSQERERLSLIVEEARLIAQLDHPNIVKVHAAHTLSEQAKGPIDKKWGEQAKRPINKKSKPGGGDSLRRQPEGCVPGMARNNFTRAAKTHAFIVLELLEGSTLSDILASRGRLPLLDVIELSAQLLDGLEHAHRAGIIHRDLHPRNAIVLPTGRLRLLDFGLAQLEEHAQSLGPLKPNGAMAYLSPEQLRGSSRGSKACDLWSAAFIIFELLTDAHPFELLQAQFDDAVRAPLSAFAPELPAALEPFFERALALDPELRFATAAQMRAALLELEAQESGHSSMPYRYLEAFGEDDAADFFGRNDAAEVLRDRLRRQAVCLVLGASGAGKSSLVMAGLLPRLQRERRHLSDGKRSQGPRQQGGLRKPWRLCRLRPGARPLRSLFDALSSLLQSLGVPAADAPLPVEPGRLASLIRESLRTERLLLFVDQFEELFSRGAELSTRRHFVALLLALADDHRAPIRLVIAMREDFLSRCTEHPELQSIVDANPFVLGPPTREGLHAALVEPALRQGYRFEAGLVGRILDSFEGVATPLPLLQLTASRLWEGRDQEGRWVKGGASAKDDDLEVDVEQILSAHADEVISRLTEEECNAARNVLVRLVSADGQRRAASRQELEGSGVVERVLESLVAGRLLVVGRSHAEASYELVHDCLIEGWGRLRDWRSKHSEEQRFRERMGAALRHWQSHGRATAGLWRGELLDEALRWRREQVLGWSADEEAFVKASQRAAVRGRRRLQSAVVALVLFLASAALASYLGLLSYRTQKEVALQAEQLAGSRERDAKRSALESRSRELALASKDALDKGEPVLGLLLAQESNLVADTPEALRVLSDALAVARELRRVGVHEHRVWRLAVHPTEALVAAASWDGSVSISDTQGRTHAVLRGHGDRVVAVDWSPDGERVATASWDGSVGVWRRDGSREHSLRGHKGHVVRVRWSPDGRWLYSAALDGVRVWSVSEQAIVLQRWLAFPEGRVRVVELSADGRLVVAAGQVLQLCTASGELLRRFEGHEREVMAVSMDREGRLLASVSRDRTARVWDLGSGELLRTESLSVLDPQAIALSPDGSRLAVADGARLMLMRLDESGSKVIDVHTDAIEVLRFSEDGTLLLSGALDHSARLFNHRGDEIARFVGHDEGVWDARFVEGVAAGEWARLVVTAGDTSLRFWSVGGQAERFRLLPSTPLSAALTADEGMVLVGDQAGFVTLLDLREVGLPQRLRFAAHDSHVNLLLMHPDGQSFLTGGYDGRVLRWSMEGDLLDIARFAGPQ
ncbi:MAG: protein kinase [Myxococcota bacterium]|nr:protein kinase [Myxococcota bacterium]